MNEEKVKKIAVIALILALSALSTSMISGLNGTNGTNSISGGQIFFLHNSSAGLSYPSLEMDATFNLSSALSYQNYTISNGNTFLINWTSPSMNLISISPGMHLLHIHVLQNNNGGNHITKLYYVCGVVNATGENFSIRGTSELSEDVAQNGLTEFDLDMLMPTQALNLTDRMIVQIYSSQTGAGSLPKISLLFDDQTDSRLEVPAQQFTQQDIINISQNSDNDSQYFNISGGKIMGNINMTGNNISNVNTISVINGITIMARTYNNYTINTTATATGVLTLNVSNSVGISNDTLIYLNGHSNSNFSDLYFTQNNVTIPFNNTDSNPGTFYLNITSLAYPIVAHYGNKSIHNLGNGNNTFDIYADGSSLEKFDTNGVTLSDGNISITANIAGGNYITTKSRLTRPQVVVYDILIPAYYAMEGFTNKSNLQSDSNPNQITFYAAGDNNFYTEYRDSSSITAVNIGARTTTEHFQKLLWGNSSTETKFYIDGVQKTSPAANFPSLTSLYFSVSSYYTNNVANILLDNILIYKYSSGKFNTWGTEINDQISTTGNLYCIRVDAIGTIFSTLGGC